MARKRNYIPGAAEGSTAFVFVQEGRTELGITQFQLNPILQL